MKDISRNRVHQAYSAEGFFQGHFKTHDFLAPEAGLEPAIALLEGKCLNHLNYSGSYNCCMRLLERRNTMSVGVADEI